MSEENKNIQEETTVTPIEETVEVKPEDKKVKKTKKEKKPSVKPSVWKPFIKFYSNFSIPWWLFLISMASGILYTEVGLKVTEYTVLINTGKLYNSAILGYIAFTLLASLVSIITNMSSSYGTGLVTLRARKTVYSKIMRMPIASFDKDQPSSFVSRITTDTPQASEGVRTAITVFTSIYSFVRYYMVLFKYSSVLTMWLLIAVPLAFLTFFLVGRTQYIAEKKIYGAVNIMMTFFSEHLAAIKHVKAQTMEEIERQEGFDMIEKRFKADVFNGFMVAAQTTINSIYTKVCTLILIFSGKKLIEQGKMESTGLNVGNQYLSNVQKYLAELLTHWQTLKGVQGVIGKVADIAATQPEELKREEGMPEVDQDIVINDVHFSYDGEKEVLHGISCVIPAGKKTAIVGNNGCGKSTLFKLLMRFYEPTSGAINYGEVDTRKIHLDEWRSSFGYVLQSSPLFSGTVRDNITYALNREASDEEVIAISKEANAYDFIMEFPEGFNKEVGEGGMRLSGGQRQRVAIARAMITNPKILLMDEATAALDYQSNELVWEACEKLMKGRTTILIAHDMNAVVNADNIIVMNHGYVEACGKHDELMTISPTYKEYINLQMKQTGGNE